MAELLNTVFPPEIIDGIAALLVVFLVLAMLASSIVQYLKGLGKIGDGQAGKWNTGISYVLVVLSFLITQVFGLGEDVFEDAENVVTTIMMLITSGFTTAVFGKVFYLVAQFIGLFTKKGTGTTHTVG